MALGPKELENQPLTDEDNLLVNKLEALIDKNLLLGYTTWENDLCLYVIPYATPCRVMNELVRKYELQGWHSVTIDREKQWSDKYAMFFHSKLPSTFKHSSVSNDEEDE